MATTIILSWILLAVACVCYAIHKWRFRSIRAIPGIQPDYPLLGNALLFTNSRGYTRCFRNQNRMTKLWLGPVPVINLQHPELVQKVLTECLDKPFAYDYMELGVGLISERYGKVWREHRRTLGPLFNTRILQSFVPVFEQVTETILQSLDEVADGRDVNLLEYTKQCSASIVHSTMVNLDRIPEELIRQLIENLEIILDALGKRTMNALYALKSFYRMSALYRKEWRSRKLCYATVNEGIDKMRQNVLISDRSDLNVANDEDGSDTVQSRAFVERLLTIQHKGRAFTDEEIANHTYTMLVAGYETSALQLSIICMMLAMHPEIQQKVIHELNACLPELDTPLTAEVLKQLTYLEMTINETLRLYPVAPLIARQSTTPITLDGVQIPSGIMFTVNIATVHRLEEFWGPNATAFDPENFSASRSAGRHPYAFIPFSGGPRVCIGNRYSMIAMKVFVVRLLQRFRVSTRLTRKDLKFKFQMTQKLVTPYTMQLERRCKIGGVLQK